MSHLSIALLVSFLSVFLPLIIGGLVGKEKLRRIIFAGLASSIGYALVLYFCYWNFVIGFYGPTPAALSVIIGGIISLIILLIITDGNFRGVAPAILISGGYLVYALGIWFFGSTDMWGNAGKKAALIGKVEIVSDLSEVLEPADPAFICQVPDTVAKVKADAALSKFKVSSDIIPGSRYRVGHPTKQYVDGQLWWIFPVEFQWFFKWKQDKQAPGYLRVSAQNPFEDAQAVQHNKQGEEIHIKFLKSASREFRADRYLRNHGYRSAILVDWTFEVDDNWNPYYTVSVVRRTTGYFGYKFTSIVILNLQTGEFKEYDPKNLPLWVDRGMPLETLDYQVKKWGKYAQAGFWYNLWHNDKAQEPTPGWYLVYNQEGKCQWFSGFTSTTKADKAMTGFVLSDSRTGLMHFYKASGLTEERAYQTANSLWSNFRGYEPTELMIYNVYGLLTYVIPMHYQGQFKGVSIVSMNNVDINARGSTLEEALANYRASLSKAKSVSLAPAGGKLPLVQVVGRVVRVGAPLIQGTQQIFSFTLQGVPKIFQVVYSYSSPKANFVSVGDEAVITYTDTREKVITCESFDIPIILLSEESPAQARYYQNQEMVKKEISRVSQEQKREGLLQSDRLKKVDQKKLEEFLNQQP